MQTLAQKAQKLPGWDESNPDAKIECIITVMMRTNKLNRDQATFRMETIHGTCSILSENGLDETANLYAMKKLGIGPWELWDKPEEKNDHRG